MNYTKLSDVAYYSELRTKNITLENYITTDNMLPNIGGICTATSLPNSKTAKYYEENDILLSNIRPYFCKIWYANRRGAASNDVLVIKAKKGINSKFLYYVLCDKNFFNYDSITSKGTKMPRGTPNAIMKYLVPNVDINTQDTIAAILSAYDDLIEKNNRKIAILQQMAEELYKEWFVRFRFPGHKAAKFEDGIPEGWEYKPFSEIATYERGISYSSEEIDCEDGVNLINLKNINAYGGFRLDGTKKYNGKYKNTQVVKYGDLVMGVTDMTQDRRTVGAVALIPYFDNTCVISADLIKIISQIDNIFVYCLCKYGYYSKFFSQFANGSNVLHLKPSSLKNQKILIPTRKLIKQFVKIVKPINDVINNLNRQNDKLAQQRDLLLPRLMSGKLKVKA